MSFVQAHAFVESLQPTAMRLLLEPLREACQLFDNPQEHFPAVHISGTNGKGSTAAFLTTVRERIRIGDEMISTDDFASSVDLIRNTLPDERSLSYFEFLTLMSFLFFRDKKVDLAVMETGLGGRFDATNLVHPLVAIIAPISFDHMHHLGDSLAKIAAEKC